MTTADRQMYAVKGAGGDGWRASSGEQSTPTTVVLPETAPTE